MILWIAATVFLVGLGLGIKVCAARSAARRAARKPLIKSKDLQQLDEFASELREVSSKLSAFTEYLHDPYPSEETRAPHE